MTTTAMTVTAAGTCLACGFVNAVEGTATVTTCGGCAERVVLTWVRGSYNGQMPCDDRCQYAVGPVCSCSCGGENHRRGYLGGALVPAYIRERDAKRHAERASRAASKAAATRKLQAAAMANLLQAHPVLEGLFDDRYDGEVGFIADMREALERGDMTDRQIAAAERAIERDAARARKQAAIAEEKAQLIAAGVKTPEGRMDIVGEVVAVRSKETYFGYQEKTVWQLIVKADEGWTVMGTLPSQLGPDSYTGGGPDDEGSWQWHLNQLVGQRVKFTARVTRSDRDETFGFYSRPSKASRV
jgi:hypothetical protein